MGYGVKFPVFFFFKFCILSIIFGFKIKKEQTSLNITLHEKVHNSKGKNSKEGIINFNHHSLAIHRRINSNIDVEFSILEKMQQNIFFK